MRQAMRRIGVMGGTFDPVHHGHLVAASEVAYTFDLDEVVFVPTGQPYQKESRREVSPAEDRYLMTVIATASNPRFSVSRVDIDRPGPTYTIDTLRDLRALLAEVQRRGYATEDGDVTPGLRSVAAAVLDHAGHPEAGVAVTFPEGEVDEPGVTRIASLVAAAAAEISRRIN